MNQDYDGSLKLMNRLVAAALAMSRDIHGTVVRERRPAVASVVFSKTCLQCLSILKLTPGSQYSQRDNFGNVWDISSVAALVRCVSESYYVLFYLCVENVPANERDCRFLLGDYHTEVERLKMIERLNPMQHDLTDLRAEVAKWRSALEANTFFQTFPPKQRQSYLNGRTGLLLTWEQIAVRAGVGIDYNFATYKAMSNFLHCMPFALHQIETKTMNGPDSEDARSSMSLLLIHCAVFISKSIEQLAVIFPHVRSHITSEISSDIAELESLAKDR